MMGVYINMEMPKEGYIDVRIKCNGTATFAIAKNPYFKAVEAVPIPEPHGRLIEADSLIAYCNDFADMYKGSSDRIDIAKRDELLAVIGQIINEPTIIPASGD